MSTDARVEDNDLLQKMYVREFQRPGWPIAELVGFVMVALGLWVVVGALNLFYAPDSLPAWAVTLVAAALLAGAAFVYRRSRRAWSDYGAQWEAAWTQAFEAQDAFLASYGIEASEDQCEELGFPYQKPEEPGVLGSSVVPLHGKAVPVTLSWDDEALVLRGPDGVLPRTAPAPAFQAGVFSG